MVKLCFVMVCVCALVFFSNARDIPTTTLGDKTPTTSLSGGAGVKDEKNFIAYGGVGGFAGVGVLPTLGGVGGLGGLGGAGGVGGAGLGGGVGAVKGGGIGGGIIVP